MNSRKHTPKSSTCRLGVAAMIAVVTFSGEPIKTIGATLVVSRVNPAIRLLLCNHELIPPLPAVTAKVTAPRAAVLSVAF